MIKSTKFDAPYIEELSKRIKAANLVRVEDMAKVRGFKTPVTDMGEMMSKNGKYTFFDKTMLDIALYELMGSEYGRNALAKDAYEHDEGEMWTMDVASCIPLGYYLKGDELIQSGRCLITFVALGYGQDSKITGLPFEIVSMTLEDPEE